MAAKSINTKNVATPAACVSVMYFILMDLVMPAFLAIIEKDGTVMPIKTVDDLSNPTRNYVMAVHFLDHENSYASIKDPNADRWEVFINLIGEEHDDHYWVEKGHKFYDKLEETASSIDLNKISDPAGSLGAASITLMKVLVKNYGSQGLTKFCKGEMPNEHEFEVEPKYVDIDHLVFCKSTLVKNLIFQS